MNHPEPTPAPKKGLNWPLLIVSILVVGTMISIFTMGVLEGRVDRKIEKVKITEDQLGEFIGKVDEMIAKYTVRKDENDKPIVHPPAGGDVYILARNYDFGDYTLELEKGKQYNLKLASKDMRHAIVVRELKLMNRIKVGEIKTIEFTPTKAGTFFMICGEFCGVGHAKMVGRMIVTE